MHCGSHPQSSEGENPVISRTMQSNVALSATGEQYFSLASYESLK